MWISGFGRQKPLLKLFSLVLAIVLWVFIRAEVQRSSSGPTAYKELKNVEVKLLGQPVPLGKNLYEVELTNRTVNVRIRGPEKEIERITASDVTAFVDISGLQPGRTYSPPVRFIMPPNIEMIGAPPMVRVEIKDKSI